MAGAQRLIYYTVLTWESSVFINRVVNFVAIGLALYILAVVYDIFSSDSILSQTVDCNYCKKSINEKVCLSFMKPHPRRDLTILGN